ncbi:YggS family pyridoxal phosphate-dependent enzyme [Bordetella sp. N]|uniref:YggS family pyridoxal phosphate-dependent enzyme n=1 Tax=Bordetella sp. N TaxID=1746199 RepID=UPI00070F662B|nr:YggS family pyridoxal phosphate-dependent enzyme [Bordetella sp. N]ALM85231.1 YggS family pyridoxal phosphate enzyme [Bordetella sp. N]
MSDSTNAINAFAVRLAAIQARIDIACRRAGRSSADVALLPVSKTFGTELIRDAAACGLRRFGESRMQEVREKAGQLTDCPVDWVVIGHLQTNKAKDAAALAAEVQSLDRLDLAQALDRRLSAEGRVLDVLVQVKTSDEPSKFGLDGAALPDFLRTLAADYPSLRVRGLMTLAVNSDDEQAVRACFRRLRTLRDAARADGLVADAWRTAGDQGGLDRLSMGMSGDFELAIEEGSTEVRIGSALFGARDYSAT